MEQNRRENDIRISHIEKIVEVLSSDVVYIKTKTNNGFGASIKSTENKVDYIDKENKESHKKLEDTMKENHKQSQDGQKYLSKKFDKIMWMFGGGAFGFVVFQIVKSFI